jgi:hypothetical protein
MPWWRLGILLTREIRHGVLRHPGRHPAIIDRDTWDRVQADLADRSPVRRGRPAHPSPLAGKVFDVSGERLTSTHANKHGKRYRYYVSRSLIIGTAADSERGWRLPASDLERAVAQMASSLLVDQHALSLALTDAGVDIAEPRQPSSMATSRARSRNSSRGTTPL